MLSGNLTVYFNLIFKALKNDAEDEDYDGVVDKIGRTRTTPFPTFNSLRRVGR